MRGAVQPLCKKVKNNPMHSRNAGAGSGALTPANQLIGRAKQRQSRNFAPARSACEQSRRSHPRRVVRDHVAIEAGAELWRADLRVEIDVIEAKALAEPEHPLKIVHQAPEEIAAHRHALGGGALKLR